jgi:hypothetical protein
MLSPQVYVSPSSQIYTPVAVSQLPQIPVPQVAVPQVAVAQRPVTRVSVAQANPVPQVSLLRVSIPQAPQVVAAQEPKVLVPQQSLSKTDDKTPVSIKVNRPENELISESLSYESSEEEEEESTSNEYSSYSDTDETSDSETVENIQVQFNEQMDLQANDDLAFAYQLEDVLNQDAQPQNIFHKYSPFEHKTQPQEPPFSIEEIQFLYREDQPVLDYMNFYVAISPNKADDLFNLMENEVSSQSILQNVQQYYQERDPYPVDDEFIIEYLTSSDDEGVKYSIINSSSTG